MPKDGQERVNEFAPMSWKRDDCEISTDRGKIDIQVVHTFLTNSYWANGIPLETVRRSIQHSLCFGIYKTGKQVGFARVITDYATYGYLADVFVLEEHRGQGLSKWLMECVVAHPELQGLRRWALVTRDAHDLYRKVGFEDIRSPQRWMERHDANVYARRSVDEGRKA
jgi:GNAT superfamily N-acetyltransferase